MIPTLEWKGAILRMLDQTRLPGEIRYIDCPDVETVAKGIRELWVRGAPAIGIAAAYGVVLGAQRSTARTFEAFYHDVETVSRDLAATRPTAVNLFWALERMKKLARDSRSRALKEIKELLLAEAHSILDEDIRQNRSIGKHGSALIAEGSGILTHCNAGSLATGGYGTALGVIRRAWEENKKVHVFADETRPVLQGARLTAWELMQDGIPVTLITDNMAGYIMQKGVIQLCIVGADRIAANGDTANKIGTYSIAILAKAHDLPFYVAAPISTIDFSLSSGEQIPIEERDSKEVTHILGRTRIAPDNVPVANPAFDVTPARFISAIITEKGVFPPHELKKLAGP